MKHHASLLVFLAGCAVDAAPETSTSSAEGLAITSNDARTGLAGTFVSAGLTVKFQTLPDSGGAGVSARWADADGFTIAVDYSGDPRAYDQWGALEPTRKAANNRAQLLDVVMQGSAALAAAKLPDATATQRTVLRELAAAIPAPNLQQIAASPEELAEARPQDRSNTFQYKQWFNVIDDGFAGAHHCTAWSNYYLDTNGNWYFVDYMLNRNGHNDTPSCSTTQCGQWSPIHGYKGSDKCHTRFTTCGLPWEADVHNCRSDSKWQQNWVMANRWCNQNGGSGGICANTQGGLGGGATCSTSTSCDSGSNACVI